MSRLVSGGVLALTFVVTACTSNGSGRPSIRAADAAAAHHRVSGLVLKSWPTGTTDVPLRVSVPVYWRITPFVGAPAPTFFPLVYLSRTALPSGCPDQTGVTTRAGSTSCFNGDWQVPADGFVVRWGENETPTANPFSFAPGHRATLSGHAARIYDGIATADCVAKGGATEIDATILRSRPGYETFVMRACLGPRASPTDRDAINRMLTTLEID